MRNAKLLDYFFENSTATEIGGKYVRNVTIEMWQLQIELWAKHNPAGESVR